MNIKAFTEALFAEGVTSLRVSRSGAFWYLHYRCLSDYCEHFGEDLEKVCSEVLLDAKRLAAKRRAAK